MKRKLYFNVYKFYLYNFLYYKIITKYSHINTRKKTEFVYKLISQGLSLNINRVKQNAYSIYAYKLQRE